MQMKKEERRRQIGAQVDDMYISAPCALQLPLILSALFIKIPLKIDCLRVGRSPDPSRRREQLMGQIGYEVD